MIKTMYKHTTFAFYCKTEEGVLKLYTDERDIPAGGEVFSIERQVQAPAPAPETA